MTTIYIAEDGTQFRDKERCRQHEAETGRKRWKDYIKGLDVEGNPLSYESGNFIDRAQVIACLTPEAVEVLQRRGDDEALNVDGIEEVGEYIWSESDDWRLIKDVIREYQKEIWNLQYLSEQVNRP